MIRTFHKYIKLTDKRLSHIGLKGPLKIVDHKKLALCLYSTSYKKEVGSTGTKKGPVANLLKGTSPETRKAQSDIQFSQQTTTSSDSSHNSNGKRKHLYFLYLSPIIAAAVLYKLWSTFTEEEEKELFDEIQNRRKKRKEWISLRHPSTSEGIPSEVPYLLIGGGTASFSAFRAIKSNDSTAQVLVISNEPYHPYMRPPLSKEMFYDEDRDAVRNLKFRQWNGTKRSLFYEHEDFYTDIDKLMSSKNGGIAVARGWSVTKVDPQNRKVYLDDGKEISYGKCLISTGAKPKNLPIFQNASQDIKDKVMMYRSINDFEELEDIITEGAKSVAIIGGGFLGSELACALSRRGKSLGMSVFQIFREEGNMAHVLPRYLTKWTTEKVKKEGCHVISNAEVTKVEMKNDKLLLKLNNDQQVEVDNVIVAVGVEPNTELAKTSGLEVDSVVGGFLVNSELEARSNLFIAGDCASFYDEKLGRRRIEHHDNAVVTGRLAGENMTAHITGKSKPYWHQSMLWSDLGPEVGYEAIGIVDSKLPTFAVYAKPERVQHIQEEAKQITSSQQQEIPEQLKSPKDDYTKGVIFYLKDNIIVGIVLWNIFSRVHIARQILKEGKTFDDLSEVAKLFEIYSE